MSTQSDSESREKARNPDPLTGEPGSHPVATGVGAAGLAAGELLDPTREDAYWREEHPRQLFAAGSCYDEYALAYRIGYEGYVQHTDGGTRERTFEDAEPESRKRYEAAGGTAPWNRARSAAHAAWTRVHERRSKLRIEGGMTEALMSQQQRSGELSNAQMPR